MESNNKLVEHTYRRHNTWLLQCAYNFTNNKDKAAELVQNLYVKMLELENINKIIYKEDVNLFYLYKMMKSIHINGIKRTNHTLPIDDNILNISAEEYSYEADNEFERLLVLTNKALEQEYWFGRQLLKTYIEEEHSIQSLHNATGISNSTIWTQLNKTKKFVREYVKDKTR
jgi:DNA-directed RNA polymerase specialized sigma24 family protein